MPDLTADLLAALVAATPERKEAALKALRGECEAPTRALVGPLLMGMGEAAKYLGVSRSTLYRIIQAGKVEKVELFSGSFRVRREDLVAVAAGEFGTGEQTSHRGRPRKDMRTSDARFQQLKALADEGDENAAADLFREFGFEHGAALRPVRQAHDKPAQGDHDADAAGQRGAE